MNCERACINHQLKILPVSLSLHTGMKVCESQPPGCRVGGQLISLCVLVSSSDAGTSVIPHKCPCVPSWQHSQTRRSGLG